MTDPIRVLHVDDEPDFAEMAGAFLEREADRFDVETATNASTGLDRLAADEFDCIVSDYEMPGRNGIEFLETVREDHPDLPFILYTGKGSEEVASDAISAGVTDYLQKGRGTEQYELLANRVRNAVEQYRATERAAELDRIRTLASDVNQALVRAESREEVETRVCEIISESDPYLFAWIGEVDPDTDRIEPRASAGIDEGYLDDVTVTDDDDLPREGPGGTAIRERRVVVSQDVAEDPEFEPWREEALERGFQSVAAVPLEYQDTLYGELAVYAERPDAFDADERELLAELGDDIAHVFHSFEVRARLREERDRRRALFENAPGPVIAGEIRPEDAEHRITDVNDAFEDVFGYEASDVVGRDVAEVVVPEDGMDRHEEFRNQAMAGDPTIAEVERMTADGSREFLLHIIPYGIDDESADGWYAWYTDISERREREQAIEELHSTTNALMEVTTSEEVAEITVDAVRDILDMPANGVHLYDEGEDGLVPIAWTEWTEEIVGEPPTFASDEGIAGTAFETGEARIYDDISTVSERYNPDTNVRSQIALPLDDHGVLLIGSPEPDAFDDTDVSLAQTLAAHATTALDRITQEQELREERDFIDQALDTLDDLFYVVGPDGELRRWNERLPEVTGYTDDDIADMETVDFFPEDEHEQVTESIEEALTTGHVTIEADVLTAYDDRIPYEFRGVRLTDPAGDVTGLVGIGRDITARKERERKLTILHDVAVDLETSGSIDAICERTIEASEEILEFDLSGIDIEEDGQLVKRATSEGTSPEGTTTMSIEEGIAGKTYRTGESFLIDDLGAHDDAKPQGPYESALSIPIGDYGVFQAVDEDPGAFDETDRELAALLLSHTESALRRLDRERQLRRQNERLEEFAGVVSHDLRNPLNVAQGRLELAREECDSEHLDDAAAAVDRSLALIDDVLTLAREGERVSEIEPVDLGAVVEGCWQTVETAEATLVVESERTIRADAGRLQQLLENLLRNAVERLDRQSSST